MPFPVPFLATARSVPVPVPVPMVEVGQMEVIVHDRIVAVRVHMGHTWIHGVVSVVQVVVTVLVLVLDGTVDVAVCVVLESHKTVPQRKKGEGKALRHREPFPEKDDRAGHPEEGCCREEHLGPDRSEHLGAPDRENDARAVGECPQ